MQQFGWNRAESGTHLGDIATPLCMRAATQGLASHPDTAVVNAFLCILNARGGVNAAQDMAQVACEIGQGARGLTN